MLRASVAARAAGCDDAGWDEEHATVRPRKCFSCNLELLPSQVHTCHNCGKDIHGKIIADTLGICVVTQLPSDMSVLFCKFWFHCRATYSVKDTFGQRFAALIW